VSWPLGHRCRSRYSTDERNPLGLQQFVGQHETEWAMLMAASTLMPLPIILLFFLAQRFFIEGITLTAIKG
jgi:multiple sugar transport system permease protein